MKGGVGFGLPPTNDAFEQPALNPNTEPYAVANTGTSPRALPDACSR